MSRHRAAWLAACYLLGVYTGSAWTLRVIEPYR